MESNQDKSGLELSKAQEKLIKNAGKNKGTLIGPIVILISVCYIWMHYYHLFVQDRFFFIFNIIIYVAIVWAAFWNYSYVEKVNNLINALLKIIKENT